MADVEAAPPISEHTLVETIRAYTAENRHAHLVERRWLCSVLEPLIGFVEQVRTCRLTDENKRDIIKFRAAELEAQIANKRSETAALERELTRCKGL